MESDEIKALYKCALESLESKRFQVSKAHMLATILSPLGRKGKSFRAFSKEKALNEEALVREAHGNIVGQSQNTLTPVSTTTQRHDGAETQPIGLLDNDYESDFAEDDLPVSDIATEFRNFKAMSVSRGTRALDFWRANNDRFPELAKVASNVFAVQATSTIPERLFSHSGHIMSVRRACMSQHLAEELVFLYENRSLLKV